MNRSPLRFLPPILILGLGLALIAFFLLRNRNQPLATSQAFVPTRAISLTPSPTSEPIVPTLPTALPGIDTPTDVPRATNTPSPTATTEPPRQRPQTQTPTTADRIIPTVTPSVTEEPVEPEPTDTPVPPTPTITPTIEVEPTETVAPTLVVTPTDTATPGPIGTWTPSPTNTPLPTWTPVSAEVQNTPADATATPVEVATVEPTATTQPVIETDWPVTFRQRFGVAGTADDAQRARVAGLDFGSYISWGTVNPAALPTDTQAFQMVRVGENGPLGGYDRVAAAIERTPGATWVIGNEPDVEIQDNLPPATYAVAYHDLYYFIKERDPGAKVAIAGVASPTPLRRFYLDIMLEYYEERYEEKMPIDVWTVHVYVLREQRDSWGIGIPTSMGGVDEGLLYEIEDHKRADIANQLITDFRWWMRERGYQNTPLIITEFGILLPADYGFEPDIVSDYMRSVINFYLNATGPTGLPSDGNRLVQQWFWFSLFDATEEFTVSNLIDDAGQLTPIGQTYADYLR